MTQPCGMDFKRIRTMSRDLSFQGCKEAREEGFRILKAQCWHRQPQVAALDSVRGQDPTGCRKETADGNLHMRGVEGGCCGCPRRPEKPLLTQSFCACWWSLAWEPWSGLLGAFTNCSLVHADTHRHTVTQKKCLPGPELDIHLLEHVIFQCPFHSSVSK